ncbi:MAG: DEAD/DEAH box helicase [Saprospiraceae bacterium]|nr:DEAD/DEAH box helicase [Saprospiraceae bacterium]
MTFQDLNLIEPIQKALAMEGYSTPTPIQAQSIPHTLKSRDLLGCAQTGTGKTAAFALPILQNLITTSSEKRQPLRQSRSLILTPTRELAIQIGDSFTAYGRFIRLRHTVIFGGVSQQKQVEELKRGIDILIATPGRLLDLIQQGFINLRQIEIFVLDEADRMLDMGFIHDVRKVIALLPKQRQTLFFSATMPPEIQKLADNILSQPVKVSVDPVSSTAETVRQSLYFVEKKDKKGLLIHLLQNPAIPEVLVFTRTKHGANKVAKDLNAAGIRAEAIHGNKSQNARQNALNAFKKRQIRALVATDIAARGIDIDDLTHVLNYEMPNIPETYVHRIGRTGRAGASGTAISFCDAEERPYVRDIQKLIGKSIPVAVSDYLPGADSAPIAPVVPPEKKSAPPRPKVNAPAAQPPKEKSDNRRRNSRRRYRGKKNATSDSRTSERPGF